MIFHRFYKVIIRKKIPKSYKNTIIPYLSEGRVVEAPTPKAAKSVSEVTVMATPACCKVRPILSLMPRAASTGLSEAWLCTITNMSSMPMPSSKKGNTLCTGPKGTPKKAHTPYAATHPMPTLATPIADRTAYEGESFLSCLLQRSNLKL